jgi:hypothetical protein
MIYPALLGFAAVLADVSFSNTIGLGTVVIGIVLVIGFAWASRKDKRSERWENLYNLADVERKEVQDKLNKAGKLIEEQKAVIAKLDALQMPVRIVELMNESVARIDNHARLRLETALEEIKRLHADHEISAEERSARVLVLLQQIVDRLPPVLHSGV